MSGFVLIHRTIWKHVAFKDKIEEEELLKLDHIDIDRSL